MVSPKNVLLIKIDGYQKRTPRRHTYSRVQRYTISLADNEGNTITVFDNFKTPEQASNVREKVQKCIEQGPYPCKIKR